MLVKNLILNILIQIWWEDKPEFIKLKLWIYRDAVKSESCGVVHTVQLNYDLGGEIE